MDYEWIEKTSFKKSDQKNKKKKINVKMPHVNKKTTSEKWKFNSNIKLGLEWAVNGLGKPSKKIQYKKSKNSKNQSEIAACEQKTTTEKPNFCSNTVLPLRKTPQNHSKHHKNFTPQNHSLFRSTSCFGVTKITTPIWLQKSWKCVNRSLKKRQRPSTIQILWIVRNQEHRNIASLSLQLRSYKKTSRTELSSKIDYINDST